MRRPRVNTVGFIRKIDRTTTNRSRIDIVDLRAPCCVFITVDRRYIYMIGVMGVSRISSSDEGSGGGGPFRFIELLALDALLLDFGSDHETADVGFPTN